MPPLPTTNNRRQSSETGSRANGEPIHVAEALAIVGTDAFLAMPEYQRAATLAVMVMTPLMRGQAIELARAGRILWNDLYLASLLVYPRDHGTGNLILSGMAFLQSIEHHEHTPLRLANAVRLAEGMNHRPFIRMLNGLRVNHTIAFPPDAAERLDALIVAYGPPAADEVLMEFANVPGGGTGIAIVDPAAAARFPAHVAARAAAVGAAAAHNTEAN